MLLRFNNDALDNLGMITGADLYSSAFSNTQWKLVPGHRYVHLFAHSWEMFCAHAYICLFSTGSKLHYEAHEVMDEIVSPIKKKVKTKFDKFKSSSSIAPSVCTAATVDSVHSEHAKMVREKSWDPNTLDIVNPKPGQAHCEKLKPKFAFVKTGHKQKSQHKFSKGTRVLPLGNYLADDYPVADTVVLDVLAKARAQSALKHVVRTRFDKMELSFFDSPFSQPIVGKAHKRAVMDKKEIDIDIVKTKVLLRKV